MFEEVIGFVKGLFSKEEDFINHEPYLTQQKRIFTYCKMAVIGEKNNEYYVINSTNNALGCYITFAVNNEEMDIFFDLDKDKTDSVYVPENCHLYDKLYYGLIDDEGNLLKLIRNDVNPGDVVSLDRCENVT